VKKPIVDPTKVVPPKVDPKVVPPKVDPKVVPTKPKVVPGGGR
jgi:hypothetical protein